MRYLLYTALLLGCCSIQAQQPAAPPALWASADLAPIAMPVVPLATTPAWRAYLTQLAAVVRRTAARGVCRTPVLAFGEPADRGAPPPGQRRHDTIVYPTPAQVLRLDHLVRWRRSYRSPWRRGAGLLREADARVLRELLGDPDAAVRGLAVEALATMHEVGDLAALAAHLDDQGAAVPRLVPADSPVAGLAPQDVPSRPCYPFTPAAPPAVDRSRVWGIDTVAAGARRAMALITGRSFDSEASFKTWFAHRQPAKVSLWWWQRRLEREEAGLRAAVAAAARRPTLTAPIPLIIRDYIPPLETRLYEREEAKWRTDVRRRLAGLPPEAEAKVLLLATHGVPSPCAICSLGLRLPHQRILELLAGDLGWADVVDPDLDVDALRNRVTERIARDWRSVLRREDLPRLRALLANEGLPHELSPSARDAVELAVGGLQGR